MNSTNTTLLIGGAAVVVGAYLVYEKSKKNKSATTELDIAKKQMLEQSEIVKAEKILALKSITNSLQNPNSVKSKIAVIQRSIGVTPDGIIGTQTLKQLKTLFPLLVNLTNDNIERIYNYVKSNPYTMPNSVSVALDYGKTLFTPLVIPNNNSGVNVFTNTFKPF